MTLCKNTRNFFFYIQISIFLFHPQKYYQKMWILRRKKPETYQLSIRFLFTMVHIYIFFVYSYEKV